MPPGYVYTSKGSRFTPIPASVRKFMRNQSKIRSIEAGFTLIELLIVMSVILILMTLAVPAMQKVNIKAHQTSAVRSLQVLNSAEGEYNGNYPQHGFACTLAQLGGNPSAGPA